jgi:hypothetical protein
VANSLQKQSMQLCQSPALTFFSGKPYGLPGLPEAPYTGPVEKLDSFDASNT